MRTEFNCGIYERVRVARGPYSNSYQHYAIVMAIDPAPGSAQLNGSKTIQSLFASHAYSVLRPMDHVTGHFEDDTSYETLLLSPSFVDAFIQSEVTSARVFLSSTLNTEAPPLVQSIWRRLRACAQSQAPEHEPLFQMCVELLIVKLIESQVGAPNPADAGDNLEAVKRAVRFIDDSLAEPIDVKSIANAAALSPYYFSRIFRATYQTSVHRFVLERRLERARQLLESSTMTISSISFETGFSSQSHLTTAFRVRFGTTPAQYRASCERADAPSDEPEN